MNATIGDYLYLIVSERDDAARYAIGRQIEEMQKRIHIEVNPRDKDNLNRTLDVLFLLHEVLDDKVQS